MHSCRVGRKGEGKGREGGREGGREEEREDACGGEGSMEEQGGSVDAWMSLMQQRNHMQRPERGKAG
jgi:hypothetical protein